MSHAVGASIGVSIGAETSTPLWGSAGEITGKLTARASADFLWDADTSVTYTSAIENPAGQDLVVFTAIPFDAYAYTVIASPDPAEVGERFTLNIPRDASVRHAEVAYYNAHNYNAPDIDSSILTHTVGSPASYASVAERDQRVDASPFALVSNKTQTCSGAGAVSELGVEWTKTNGTGFSAEVSLEAEFESVTGGLLLGLTTDYHFSTSVVWYYGEGINIVGRVGDVMPQDFEDSLAFDWGVYAYKKSFPNQDQPFIVVDYWVE